jgi:hypothetical protein
MEKGEFDHAIADTTQAVTIDPKCAFGFGQRGQALFRKRLITKKGGWEPAIADQQPATHRDMSVCVADPDMELLGDRIRDVLGERGGWVENVELIQASDYASVPEKARERFGMSPGQHNLLIRVTLRSLDGSIAKEGANRAYDLVYAELYNSHKRRESGHSNMDAKGR